MPGVQGRFKGTLPGEFMVYGKRGKDPVLSRDHKCNMNSRCQPNSHISAKVYAPGTMVHFRIRLDTCLTRSIPIQSPALHSCRSHLQAIYYSKHLPSRSPPKHRSSPSRCAKHTKPCRACTYSPRETRHDWCRARSRNALAR